MLRKRVAAVAAVVGLAAGVGATTSAQATDVNLGPATVRINASAPILGDLTNGLQSVVSGVVGATTNAVCSASGNNSTVCVLNILSYGVATDYKKPDGKHVVKVTGGIVNLPTLVDATGDGLPDLIMTIQAVSPSNIKMTIQRLLTAPSTMPISVEALVNDPSSGGRIINVGYDTRNTTAPTKWIAQASLTTGTATTVSANLSVEGAPSSMAVVGGLYNQGDNGARNNPKQARLNYTPVPASSTVGFSLSPANTTGSVSAVSQTKADLELLMLDGHSGQHITGTIDKLQKPLGLVLDKVDAQGNETDGTTGDQHVRVTTQKDVASTTFNYEEIDNDKTLTRVHLNAGPLPGQTDFTQTASGLLLDTDAPIANVSGGISSGKKAVGNKPAVYVPDSFPVESNEASYVHQDTAGGVDSTTFRVAGVQHVKVDTTGADATKKIAIGARMASAPLHVLVTDDTAPGGTKYDANVNNVPHNVQLNIAPGQKRMLDFCGSSNDAADPCSAAGQANPAGIAKITLNPSYAPKPIFANATHLSGEIDGLPSTLGLDVETHTPKDKNDSDQNTRVYIDATHPIGTTILRATDGSAAPADPVDNGLVYIDSPTKFAVIAKVDGFTQAHLDTDPSLDLKLGAAAGHDFSYNIDLAPADKPEVAVSGYITKRPANTHVTFGGDPVKELDVTGTTEAGLPAITPHLVFTLGHEHGDPIFSEATTLTADVTNLPANAKVTIDAGKVGDNMKVHVNATPRLGGTTIIRATGGNGSPPADPADNGVIYQGQAGQPFAIIAKIDGFKSVSLDTKPKLDLSLDAAAGHTLDYGIHLPADNGKPASDFTGQVVGRPQVTKFSFDSQDGQPMTMHVEGDDALGHGAATGAITLNAKHLDDDPAAKIHNVAVTLTDVPPALDLTKKATTGDALDLGVDTTGGSLGVADVVLDNDSLPPANKIPDLPQNGGGAIAFTGGGHFYVHAHVKQLRSVELSTAANLEASIDVAVPQDFRVYLNTGVGKDYTVDTQDPDDDCDFDADQHNTAHEEWHDVMIKQLQPHTTFRYTSGEDIDPDDPCNHHGWRTIDYQAQGRANSITYTTDVGDMAYLTTTVGQQGSNPLQVPDHLRICQASSAECFKQIGRHQKCKIGGIEYGYCDTDSADTTVYLEAYGEKTHVSLDLCSLNNDGNHTSCTHANDRQGVFVDLNFSHLDLGYHYNSSAGWGFMASNTQRYVNGDKDGPNQGATGFVRAINHDSAAKYINLNFGWDHESGGGHAWDSTPTTFDMAFKGILAAAPEAGVTGGDFNCQEAAYGFSFDDTDSYFHVILAGPETDLGDNLTDVFCGLF